MSNKEEIEEFGPLTTIEEKIISTWHYHLHDASSSLEELFRCVKENNSYYMGDKCEFQVVLNKLEEKGYIHTYNARTAVYNRETDTLYNDEVKTYCLRSSLWRVIPETKWYVDWLEHRLNSVLHQIKNKRGNNEI